MCRRRGVTIQARPENWNLSGVTNLSVTLRVTAPLKRGAKGLRQYRMIKVVSRRVNLAGSFAADPSGADANFAGLLEVNQEICIR